MRMALTTLSQVIGAIILIGITSRYFLLAMAGVTAGCWLLASFYRPSELAPKQALCAVYRIPEWNHHHQGLRN
ncbi:hypothetical protein PGTUg99_019351 [Puccinia graminis f. sp. tritici]|uniref:Uncharacterized protein n=1 Tax=Puccinia graminis f. sp. tritici TaxID=56615 RepID=A0A5B0NV50_PUCGR|nr:hypothetical protein PGTUg99_002868 [Puccinia graminis f. sp. tritici]KAA1098799.1 hypothetical protein PGTUg99_019351 [Puccinia graminis f. sp. tritici]